MRKIRVSSSLTVYHDGQFWVGMFERVEEGRYSACRIVFGAEPSNEEVQKLICERLSELRFTRSVAHDEAPGQASNPKRRQREAARATHWLDDGMSIAQVSLLLGTPAYRRRWTTPTSPWSPGPTPYDPPRGCPSQPSAGVSVPTSYPDPGQAVLLTSCSRVPCCSLRCP